VGRDGGYSRAAQLKQPCTPYNTAGTWKPPPVWGVRWFEELPPFEILTSERQEWGFDVNHRAGGTWHGQCQREEAFRPGKTPFRGVWAGRAPCPWATPWRKAL
jgi:hypothetical protein